LGQSGLWLLAIPGLVGAALIWGELGQFRLPNRDRGRGSSAFSLGGQGKWLALLNVVAGFRAWALAVVVAFVPLLFVRMGYSQVAAGGLLTFFLLAGTVGIIAGGYLTEHLSRKALFVGSMGASLLSFALLVFTSGPLSWVMLGLSGAVLQAPIPLTVIMAQELVPAHGGVASGMIMGLAVGIGNLGAMVTGMIGDRLGLLLAVRSVILLLALGTVLAFLYPSSVKEGSQ
ncbi:MAG: hypothetical protein M1598_08355, partial [Actinobacteria bacterium]|nr:hypothetical protein [Actinomycetota bacterium]